MDTSNSNLLRAREGHLEIIEVGVLTGVAAAAVNHQFQGIPADCELIENDWADDGAWGLGDLEDPGGGLFGSATIVNVAEGLALPYDAVALQNFWRGAGLHSEPGSEEPNLSSAFPRSQALLDNGELAVSEWSTGHQAVSAVLMNTYVYNEYALESFINGKSEWVVTFPSKKFHTEPDLSVTAPFSANWNGQISCDSFELEMYDREEQIDVYSCTGICGPRPSLPELCYSSNTIEFSLPEVPQNASSDVLGSNNLLSIKTPYIAVTESGWAGLIFGQTQQRMNPVSGHGYLGLPVTGFAVQQFTNAGAAEGLLAQYGSLFMHKGAVTVDSGQ